MELTIKTNHQPRNILYGYELPAKVRTDFDYISDEDFDCHEFAYYRGNYYDLSDFMRIDTNAPAAMRKYDGYIPDTFFSGVLVKYVNDNDQVIMATYII